MRHNQLKVSVFFSDSSSQNGDTKKSSDEEAIVGAEEIDLETSEQEVKTVDEVTPPTEEAKQETPDESEQEGVKSTGQTQETDEKTADQSEEADAKTDQSSEMNKSDDQLEGPVTEIKESHKEEKTLEPEGKPEDQGHTNPTFQNDETS